MNIHQVRAVQDQIVDCEHRIDEHQANKEQLNVSCEELQRLFKKLVVDNKFADFLRKIFKKKYRPPRDRDEDGRYLQYTGYMRESTRLPRAPVSNKKSLHNYIPPSM